MASDTEIALRPKNHLRWLNETWEEGDSQKQSELLLLYKTNMPVIHNSLFFHPVRSPSPGDYGFGMIDGGKNKLFLCFFRTGMSRTRSPAAINLVPRPLKPESNNVTALQTKEEIRSMRGRGSKRGNPREERKTSCSRWHQMYLRGSSRGSAERMQSRYERLQTGSEHQAGRVSARRGWANARGRKGESPLPPLDSTWFMWQL